MLSYWKKKLETKVEEIAHLNAALVEVTPDNDADMERELEDSENAERKSGTLLEVSRILEQFEETDASLAPLQESTSATSNSHSSHIRMPEFDLPKFNGEYKKWISFYEQFMASVDNYPSIPAIQKFNYLKASLNEEALQLIAHLPLSNSNYPIALKTLVDRYNNPRFILNSHLEAVFDLKPFKDDSASELRKLFVIFDENLMAIKALELGDDLEDFIWVRMIAERLDHASKALWENDYPGTKPQTLKQLREFIGRRVQALESATKSTPKVTEGPHHKVIFKRNLKTLKTARLALKSVLVVRKII